MRSSQIACGLLVAGVCGLLGYTPGKSEPAKPEPAKPVSIVELRCLPATLTMHGPRDSRRFIVQGKDSEGTWQDVTHLAKPSLEGDCVRLSRGYVVPLKDGKATLTISLADRKTSLPVEVADLGKPAPVSFVRDVMPIFARAGCNAGTCHGAARGRNGFKLSLRGYDPAFDFDQIVEDIAGRRIDLKEPANSLVLLKPTQGVPHEGKLAFKEQSRYYQIMHQWIAEGCKSDAAVTKRVQRLEVLPQSPVLDGIGKQQQLVVLAHFADGSSRDVTREAIYTSSVASVASVDADGLVQAVRKGETAILVRYEGQFAVDPLSVLLPSPDFKWTKPAENNWIDKLVNQKLERVKVLPSDLCSDTDFLRRVHLDLIGIPPTPEEVRAFLADKRESLVKRRGVVDQLLERPEYVDFWTLRWADIMQVNRKYLGEKGVWAFRHWLRKQVVADRPWNETARDLITGNGSTIDVPASAFFRIAREPDQAVENTTHLFLGIRFNCNKCHDHPFERWTQDNYYQLAAFWTQADIKKGAFEGDEVVFEKRSQGEIKNPRSNQAMTPHFPFEHAGFDAKQAGSMNRREQLARWVTATENPYFARSMANRLWAMMTGRGIIDPVDDIRAGNPASNPELLDALTADFIKQGFRIKPLLRTIVNSRTYQLAIVPNPTNKDDLENFSHARPRRLTSEQLLDSVRLATGTANHFPGLPTGFRAAQLPEPAAGKGSILEQFGQPVRESPCECERRNEMSLGQALTLVNGPTVSNAIADPNGRLSKLFKTNPDDRQVVEEIYLATLCRLPTDTESTVCIQQLAKQAKDPKARQQVAQDLMWALLNSPAFLFNR